MKINLKNGLKEFETRYSFFHDGFLKAIEVSSGNHFRQEMEWEKPKQYKTNEERLLDTGMVIDESVVLNLKINHYNYDWPNQPYNRQIHLNLLNATDIEKNIHKLVGLDIFDLSIKVENKRYKIVLTYHPKRNDHDTAPVECSMDNGIQVTICTFKEIFVKEILDERKKA